MNAAFQKHIHFRKHEKKNVRLGGIFVDKLKNEQRFARFVKFSITACCVQFVRVFVNEKLLIVFGDHCRPRNFACTEVIS